jgi:tRNA A37 threonylcarbamoyladenosine synthetase subunit TsaC/SUA5/YrdC
LFQIIGEWKKPLVSTSANISGQPTLKVFEISPRGVNYVVNLLDKLLVNHQQ